ncbi:hypothetical protein [Sinorhizobium fredii]|uniref:hypothetical protein n=1 Tax=Rhizobium fredii TaxID=380 RepID=UPI000B047F78|nr:hypothetical protein [Sinorhizobium fredii]WOS61381.1 hypothetical protein SFGR64A_10440 [Sinorhizobium fredii GR64]
MTGNRDLLQTYRALLELRERDIDRLIAQRDADRLFLLVLLERGHIAAAKAILQEQLS